MRIRRLALVAVLLAAAGVVTEQPVRPAAAAIGGLTWADEFTGAAGTPPNAGRWAYDVGGGGWGNNELEYYTTSTRNAAHDGTGNLVITARRENPSGFGCWYGTCQYTSARLKTAGRFTQAYGRFEARLRVPRGQGLWPAFWMLGDNIGSQRRTPADLGGNRWVFDHPFFLILNVAVGGNWPGSPDASTVFPQTMTIDYVRVYAWTSGGGGRTGAVTGFGGKCVDVAGANSANGTQVQLWTCNGTNAQQWTVGTDGTVRALGKCLDVSGGSIANGAKVQVWDCNGTGAQQWRATAAGELVNPQSGRCLDAAGASSADGTPLQTWSCHGGANQRWNLPA